MSHREALRSLERTLLAIDRFCALRSQLLSRLDALLNRLMQQSDCIVFVDKDVEVESTPRLLRVNPDLLPKLLRKQTHAIDALLRKIIDDSLHNLKSVVNGMYAARRDILKIVERADPSMAVEISHPCDVSLAECAEWIDALTLAREADFRTMHKVISDLQLTTADVEAAIALLTDPVHVQPGLEAQVTDRCSLLREYNLSQI